MGRRVQQLAVVAFLLGFAPWAMGQGQFAPDAPPAPVEPSAAPLGVGEGEAGANRSSSEGSPISLSIRAGTTYAFRADLHDTDASVSRFVARGGFGVNWDATDKLRLRFGVDYEYLDYDFEGGSNIIPDLGDNPFNNFNDVFLSVVGTYLIDREWFLTCGGFSYVGWEAGADLSDAWLGGGFGTVGWRFSDTLRFGLGIGVSSQLETDPIFYPAIILRWQINEVLRLEEDRLGARLTYSPLDDVDFYVRANWLRREYRLDDDHPKIGDGVLRDTTVPVGVGVAWHPVAGLSVELEGGAIVYSELKFRNERGNTVRDSELDPAPYIGLRVEYSF